MRRVIHCDIKPSNITLHLLAQEQATTMPYLIDFGLSCTLHEDMHTEAFGWDQCVGTPIYMSPHLHRRQRKLGSQSSSLTAHDSTFDLGPCRRDDLFSLAVTLIAICVGEPRLPWYNTVISADRALTMQDHCHLAAMKEEDLPEDVAKDLPYFILRFFKYTQSLKYAEDPSYTEWYHIFLGHDVPLIPQRAAGLKDKHIFSTFETFIQLGVLLCICICCWYYIYIQPEVHL